MTITPISNPFGLVRIEQNNINRKVILEFAHEAGSTAFFYCWHNENFNRILSGRLVHCYEGVPAIGDAPPLKINEVIQLLTKVIGPDLWNQLNH